MNYYVEITLLPHSEIEWHFLWEKVYQQLHLGLVTIKDENDTVSLGVSFPSRNVKRHHLGHQLRLFAPTQEQLEQFNAPHWLNTLSDYVHLTHIRAVPKTVKEYGSYFRIQTKSNNEQLSKRRSKRLKISVDEATKHFATRQEKQTDAPFVYVKSSSSGKRFPLFIGYIEQIETREKSFNCYGLSKKSTVPVF